MDNSGKNRKGEGAMGTQRAILVLLVGIMWLGLLAGADAQGTGNIERGVLVSPARLVATVESGD